MYLTKEGRYLDKSWANGDWSSDLAVGEYVSS